MNKTDRKQLVEGWRKNHHRALESIAESMGIKGVNGKSLWQKLSRIESKASKIAVKYCNGEIGDVQADRRFDHCQADVARLFDGSLPLGFFINRDPRGYALKIERERDQMPEGLHQDWGRYGILAAEIE